MMNRSVSAANTSTAPIQSSRELAQQLSALRLIQSRKSYQQDNSQAIRGVHL